MITLEPEINVLFYFTSHKFIKVFEMLGIYFEQYDSHVMSTIACVYL